LSKSQKVEKSKGPGTAAGCGRLPGKTSNISIKALQLGSLLTLSIHAAKIQKTCFNVFIIFQLIGYLMFVFLKGLLLAVGF